jgi:hypothetical protein
MFFVLSGLYLLFMMMGSVSLAGDACCGVPTSYETANCDPSKILYDYQNDSILPTFLHMHAVHLNGHWHESFLPAVTDLSLSPWC